MPKPNRPRPSGGKPRRLRGDDVVPDVPTYPEPPKAAHPVPPTPAPPSPTDLTEEELRQIVEAAYM